jgi:hypothetical protein
MTIGPSAEVATENLFRMLSPSEQDLVWKWERLGVTRTQAVINVMGRHIKQRAPSDVGWLESQERWPAGSIELSHRRCAEHESAHVVVARELGMPVGRVVAGYDGEGHAEVDTSAASRADHLAMLVASEVWAEHRSDTLFPTGDSGCASDRRQQIELGADHVAMRQAAQVANRILGNRRAEVLNLADRLERFGEVDLSGQK